jgi:CRP-like cAMP-binding protein
MHYRLAVTASYSDALSNETIAAIRDLGTTSTYPARAWVFSVGADSGSVLFVESGLLRVERPTSTGRTVLLELTSEGGTLGELGAITGAPRSASVITVEPSTVITVGADAFNDLVESHPDLNRYVMTQLADRIVALTSQLIEASDRSATARVASRLVELLDRSAVSHEATPTIPLPISQQELGQWAGLSREGTAKALRELRESGVVLTKRMEITLLKPDTLRELARTAGRI